jgi:hypothetical protein
VKYVLVCPVGLLLVLEVDDNEELREVVGLGPAPVEAVPCQLDTWKVSSRLCKCSLPSLMQQSSV